MDKEPTIIPREQHKISRSMVDKYALKVLYRLHEEGYQAYLVGGCVRDLLLDAHPKDFDVATNATPEEIKKVFRNCRLIGRRFRLAHIYFGRHIIEVATFRGNTCNDDEKESHIKKDGILVRDNSFGDIQQDAWRRDFSINALYYNIADFSIVDYADGLRDMQEKQLRILGDPVTRYREDPIRMLRAIRFAAKLRFKISATSAEPIKQHGDWLEHIAPSRLLDEIIKLFHCGHAKRVYALLKKYKLLAVLLPGTYEAQQSNKDTVDTFINALFQDTDKRIAQHKTVSTAYLFAVLLWPVVVLLRDKLLPETPAAVQALIEASYQALYDQSTITTIPRRLTHHIHQIWRLQYRLEKPNKKVLIRTLKNSRFRAALDLFKLRAQVDPTLKTQLHWWEAREHILAKQSSNTE